MRKIEAELDAFGAGLLDKERWLVLNKIDQLEPEDYEARRAQIVEQLDWRGPVHTISALTGAGTETLINDLMYRLEALKVDPESTGSAQSDEAASDWDEFDDSATGDWHPLD